MRVLMATDGSVHASGAMLTASRLLHRKNLEVDVLYVAPELPGTPKDAEDRVHHSYKKRHHASAQRTLDDAQRILSHSHLKTKGILETGSPAERLLIQCANYDITVVGAYGNHDRKQSGLGPVTSRLLQLSEGNILIGRELINQDNFRVLVALDSSEASFTALQTLGKLFDTSALDVTLMHVLELPWAEMSTGSQTDDNVTMDELSDYQIQLEKELKRAASNAIDRAQRLLEQWQIPVTTLVEEGDPALELCSQAEEGGYDLIVSGATGVSDVKHALMGSVSLKLAWNAPCSVAVIRQPIE